MEILLAMRRLDILDTDVESALIRAECTRLSTSQKASEANCASHVTDGA
jgi:hypothetical protein